jgi:hypothetical protein
METSRVTLFLATPFSGLQINREYLFGCVDASHRFRGLTTPLAPLFRTGPYVEENRDALTAQFERSGASHLLFVDPDVGFRADHVQALLDTNKPVVCGAFCPGLTGGFGGSPELLECQTVEAGFLLVTRGAVLRLMAAAPNDIYPLADIGMVHALWTGKFEPGGPCHREAAAFSERCRNVGLYVLAHCGVVLRRYGDRRCQPG